LAVSENRPDIATAIEEIRTLIGAAQPKSNQRLLHFTTLGAFRVAGAEKETTLPAPKRGREVIAYFATFPGRTVARDTLGEAFWPGLEAGVIAHRLHMAVSGARTFLREVLDGLDAIRCTSAGYNWHPDVRVRSDLAVFSAYYREGTPEAFRTATALYGGDFLAGEQGDWLEPIRVKCSSMQATMLERLADIALSYGEHSEALGYGLDLLAVDRANEAASRMVMRCFAALGRRGRALAEYEALRAYLRKHLGLEPTFDTQNVMRAIVGAQSPEHELLS
jgi:DNA-binding SARP family transcriptional activator